MKYIIILSILFLFDINSFAQNKNTINKNSNSESSKKLEKTYTNPNTILFYGFSGLAVIFYGAGIYYNSEVVKYNKEYDDLSGDYDRTTDPVQARSIHDDMVSTHHNAEKNTIYRNFSYGIAITSTLIAGYFGYRYFTWRSPETYRASGSESNVIPLFAMNYIPILHKPSEYFFQGGVVKIF